MAEGEVCCPHTTYHAGPCERLSWRAVAEAAQAGFPSREIAIRQDSARCYHGKT